MDVATPGDSDPNYARILSIKKDAAINVITASLKADENCFRQRRTDALDRLYAAVQADINSRGALIDNVEAQSQPV